MYKWIGALIGGYMFKFPGAVLGFIIGYFIEQYSGKNLYKNTDRKSPFRNKENISPRDFELNLLSLASLVIKADGQVNQNELDYVRQYFVRSYGKERANATFKTFNEVIKSRQINAMHISAYIASRTRYEARLQILHFLFGIAASDGGISANEDSKIREIAGYFRLSQNDYNSIRAMFFKEAGSGNAYKILEIERTATDTEIKKAYRKMAKKYHPDKLQHLPPHLIKGAEEKFQSVQQAYDQLQKERGFK